LDVEVRDLLAEIGRIRETTRKLVLRGGDAGVGWKPPVPDTNSVAVIVTHMCGSERQWIHEYVGGQKVRRDRDSEFKKPVSTANELVRLLEGLADATTRALEGETSQSLGRSVTTHNPSMAKTARDCILHSISHQSVHVGHLEMTLQLWEHRKVV
jgi:uncharacterized damage-inducible protein DinB